MGGDTCYNRHMRKETMEILACPVCKEELELTVDEENEREVVGGSLYCRKCDFRYPIKDTIPNLTVIAGHQDTGNRIQ